MGAQMRPTFFEARMADLLKEITQTKERAAAWVFRILIALVGASTTAVLWMAWGALADVKNDLKTGIQQQWLAIGKINDAQAQVSRDIGIQTQVLADHIRTETDIDASLRDIAKDHEGRIRTLEHPLK
jgi:hypothetical protein